ncbi:nicotinamide-nucleotide amidase [Spiroplasma chinense]|uniref:Nicotinamide-nucleotide amidase n=1 Tax=Spiroplasma chinense TaxID=216932 RepID=A0A5B9Y6C7_9MOLU|nr:CinA family protein [Spiroplasma chinense]QEH61622.1 nicotinamide-nucleotide amidase [Spiroplasma chinense]
MKYLFDYLKKHNLKLSTCESFTGGMFANQFTNIPGASNFFTGSFVCYSNDFKIEQVNIDQEVIKKYSEVSQETLQLMLKNTQEALKTDICFAFTGWATPIDKTNKNSGLSYVGFLLKDKIFMFEFIIKHNFSRKKYKKRAIKFVLKEFKKVS